MSERRILTRPTAARASPFQAVDGVEVNFRTVDGDLHARSEFDEEAEGEMRIATETSVGDGRTAYAPQSLGAGDEQGDVCPHARLLHPRKSL